MKHWGMLACMAVMALAVVLIVAGADALVFIPALACAAMMGMMVWMMMRHRWR